MGLSNFDRPESRHFERSQESLRLSFFLSEPLTANASLHHAYPFAAFMNAKKRSNFAPQKKMPLVAYTFVLVLLRSSHPPAREKTPPMSVLPPSAPPSPAPALQSPNPISAASPWYSKPPNTLASPDKYRQSHPSSTAAQSVFSIRSLSSSRLYCPHPPVSTAGYARRCDKLTSRQYATSIRSPCTRNLPVGQSPVIRLARSSP